MTDVVVNEDDLILVIDLWRSANEAPGGISPRQALDAMKPAIWRLEQARRAQGGKPL